MSESPRAHLSFRSYVVTWLVLVGLTVLTFFASRAAVKLGPGWDVSIALAIATSKSVLVLLVFMHLVEQSFMNRIVMLVAALFIALLIAGMVADVATRDRVYTPATRNSPGAP